jgi:hypothetical protein
LGFLPRQKYGISVILRDLEFSREKGKKIVKPKAPPSGGGFRGRSSKAYAVAKAGCLLMKYLHQCDGA